MRYLLLGMAMFLAWSAGATWWYVCKIKGLCPVVEEVIVPSFGELPNQLSIKAGENAVWESDKLLLHRVGEVAAQLPEDFPLFASVLAEYQALHPEGHWALVGLADPKEMEQAELLAILRAQDLASKLAQFAPAGLEVVTEGQVANLAFTREGVTSQAYHWDWRLLPVAQADSVPADSLPPAEAEWIDPPTSENDPISVSPPAPSPNPSPTARPIANPSGQAPAKRTILFSFAKPEIASPADLDRYINEVIAYLQAHPDRKVRISGHTDDTASREANLRLGQNRADLIAELFRNKGLAENRMLVESVGEKEPVAPNDTREGRALNRRTDIEIR